MPRTLILLRPNLGVLQIGIKSQGYREPDTVMSDSDELGVTYTEVSSTFEGLPDIGSPGVEDESSEDDEDDDVDIEAEDEEEEEHLAPVDSAAVALPAADQAPSAEETEPFETDESVAMPPPHPTYRVAARISIPAPVPTPVWSDAEVARLLAISTPPASPLGLMLSAQLSIQGLLKSTLEFFLCVQGAPCIT
ncbi:hypothetical protein Tco_0405734 [Tanacetum coccineum]